MPRPSKCQSEGALLVLLHLFNFDIRQVTPIYVNKVAVILRKISQLWRFQPLILVTLVLIPANFFLEEICAYWIDPHHHNIHLQVELESVTQDIFLHNENLALLDLVDVRALSRKNQ